MPERQERFFWMYAKPIDGEMAKDITDHTRLIFADWGNCPLDIIPCVEGHNLLDRLWLFRLRHGGNRRAAIDFSKRLDVYIKDPDLKQYGVSLSRRSNFLTPLLCLPLTIWGKSDPTDIGLHAVNDEWNSTLMTYSYHYGRSRYGQTQISPIHRQVNDLRWLFSAVEQSWQMLVCDCRGSTCTKCQGSGCFRCFQLGGTQCGGTGWKNFSRWTQGGYRIDYSKGFPIALI